MQFFVAGGSRWYTLLWVQKTWRRKHLWWRKTQLLSKRTAAIMYDDTITTGSKRPGSQSAEGCSNILGTYHYLLLPRLYCQSPETDGLWSDLTKLFATVGLGLTPSEFQFLHAFLLVIVRDLIKIAVWLTWQSLPWYRVSVLCPLDPLVCHDCFIQCCAKGEMLTSGVT